MSWRVKGREDSRRGLLLLFFADDDDDDDDDDEDKRESARSDASRARSDHADSRALKEFFGQ